jgi:hypothetical protein
MMINLQLLSPMDGPYVATSVTENGETRQFIETSRLTKWEAIRMLMSVETFLIFPQRDGGGPQLDPQVRWRSWCDVKQAMYRLLRECEDAYLEAFRKSLGL